MANVNSPFGLQLVEDNSQSPLEMCFIPASDGTAVFVGDAVKTAGSSGNIVGCPKKKTVAQCAATNPIYGVVVGFLPQMVSSGMDLGIKYRKASTAMYCLVKPANNQDLYRVQCDDASGAVADVDIGLNADFVVGSGSTFSGMSAMQLNTSSKAVTSTLSLKIVGFEDKPSNDTTSVNKKVLVRLNNIELSGGTGTVGL